jgi:D-serine deaminase-like pyridoxal phosphate-dependent protein
VVTDAGTPPAFPGDLDTPVVVVDGDRLDHNVTSWAARLAERGTGLRPHTKTHKCLEIARRQVAAGAVGLTVATLGEAEALADAGFTSLFQAYPLWAGAPAKAARVRALHDRADLMVGVESAEGALALGRAVRGAGRPLAVLIEVDCGLRRTGVADSDVAAVARVALEAGLDVRGAFTFGGHGYRSCDHIAGAADDEVNSLAEAAAVLEELGVPARVLSAGSTPTAMGSARAPVTDERPGTYVFQDRQQVALGVASVDEVALVVVATVVASHPDGRFVIDAGSKVMSSDRPPTLEGYGALPAYPDAMIRSLSEHHAVAWTQGPRPPVGTVLAVVPNHCCVVVNLADELTIVSDGELVDRWPLVSRGRNS